MTAPVVPPILSDFQVRALARDAWRRQLVRDQALERRLAQQRTAEQIQVQAAAATQLRLFES